MIDFIYFDMTGSVPFDLPFSIISFFAISGYIIKVVRSFIFGRVW